MKFYSGYSKRIGFLVLLSIILAFGVLSDTDFNSLLEEYNNFKEKELLKEKKTNSVKLISENDSDLLKKRKLSDESNKII